MPSPFVIEEYVRWSDVDFAGIIFYGSYVRFFELAETELFRAAGLPFGTVFDQYDVFLPRVQVHTEFHSPAEARRPPRRGRVHRARGPHVDDD